MEDIDFNRRFGGVERLYGKKALDRFKNSHVCVIGIGGVGSWAVEALSRNAIGKITLIDLDHIAASNINRQIHALDDTLGMSKILAMQQRIAHINPQCVVDCVDEFVTPENWPTVLHTTVNAVIDACDQIKAKTAMAAWAMHTNTIYITVGAAGGKREAHKVDIDDLSLTTHDPLLAQLRYRLRREHQAPRDNKKIGISCVFSKESVAPADASCAIEGDTDGSLNCHGYGSVVSVTATFGQCAAGWVIDKISTL